MLSLEVFIDFYRKLRVTCNDIVLPTYWDKLTRLGNGIDKKLLSTINKILIDNLSIRSFLLLTNC